LHAGSLPSSSFLFPFKIRFNTIEILSILSPIISTRLSSIHFPPKQEVKRVPIGRIRDCASQSASFYRIASQMIAEHTPNRQMSGMGRLAFGLLILIFFGVARDGYSAGPFGPPEAATNEQRETSVGVGYFWNEAKWEPSNSTEFPSVEMGQNVGYLYAGSSVFETGEVYLRLGMADLKETGTTGSFEGDYKGYASVGMKGLWFGEGGRRRSSFGAGPILQGSYRMKYEQKQIPLGIGGTADITIENFWDVGLAFGLQWWLFERLLVFGGPFGYYSQADARLTSSTLGDFSTKFKSDSNIGGYAGVRYSPFKGWILEAEGQYLSNFSGGVSLILTF